MKNLLKYSILLAFAAGASAFASDVDLSKSKVIWKGTKVIGSSHTGEVKLKSADLKYEKGEPVSGKIVVDMTSLTNTDLSGKMAAKLVGHLKSDDFFSVEKHKTATLDIKKISKASEKFYLIQGDLTIKGQKQAVKLKAEITKDSKKMQTVLVDFDFDRTKYGIKYGSGSFFTDLGDKMISDEVNLKVELTIKKSSKLAAN